MRRAIVKVSPMKESWVDKVIYTPEPAEGADNMMRAAMLLIAAAAELYRKSPMYGQLANDCEDTIEGIRSWAPFEA